MLNWYVAVLIPAASIFLGARAETVELRPAADTTLHQTFPNNNLGAHTHVAAGATASANAARGLFRFDLSAIPTNAVIGSVSITFNLPAIPRGDANGSIYAVHRVLKGWGEGTKTGNQGTAASAGEATWLHRAQPETWEAPGGAAGADFASAPSATQLLGPAPGVYTVASTDGLVADVQSWVTNAQENFGWILKAQNEAAALTARRFSSRETASGAILRVEYSVAASQLLITEIERVEANVIIRWTGGQGSVTVERVREHGAEWEVVGASANGEFSDALQESAAYYRLRN